MGKKLTLRRHTIGNIQQENLRTRDFVNTEITHNYLLSWLGTSTFEKKCRVNLDLWAQTAHDNEMKLSCTYISIWQ